LVTNNKINIVGGLYNMDNGKVELLDIKWFSIDKKSCIIPILNLYFTEVQVFFLLIL
jgi:hypothetical protein